MATELPTQAKAVIIGGGIVGCSLAYHLSALGWKDIVLLERKSLTSGTTWHAAGLVGQLRPTQNLTRLAKYTAELYASLEAETGQATGFKQNGSLGLATTDARMEEFKRGADMARTFGLEVHVLGPSEVGDYHPLITTADVVGGVFLPKDGQCNPADTTMALAAAARRRGVAIFQDTKVTDIRIEHGRATGVVTDRGAIDSDYVVNCAGMWGREIGLMGRTPVPLHACEHFYVVTEPVDEVTPDLPVLRDPDNGIYCKEDAGKILLGCFELDAKPWGMDGIPDDFAFGELPEDLDHIAPYLEAACRRLPAFEKAGIRTFFNGPESFTPDDRYLLGESPEVRNLFVACGFNSIGIQSAGGAGKVLAEWMDAGSPPCDLWDVDIRRMQRFQSGRRYLYERSKEVLGLLYADHYPYRQMETARGIRRSPLHGHLEGRGACFGEVAGWERANWFAPTPAKAKYEYSWKRQNWFPHAAEEHRAVREAAALFDLTSFAKFRVEGPDAEAVLQQVSAADVAMEPGRLVYTQWLNERGGIEADLTVTRLSETAFLVVTAAASAVRDLTWLKRAMPEGASCVVTDVTAAEAVIAVMGPNSRSLLGEVTSADLSNDAFPFGAVREIEVGMAPVRAHRISYVGELGWELYVSSEFACHVFETITAKGGAHGLRLAGYHVLDSCRIEKAYRHFGHDITDEDHVLEAGLGFAVALDKAPSRFGHFNGRDAVLRMKQQGLQRRLLQFKLKDPEPLLYHNEPILRDGEIAGYVTSANYGHHLGGAVGLGYVSCQPGESPDSIIGRDFEIDVAGERFAAEASLRPMYDPASKRMRV